MHPQESPGGRKPTMPGHWGEGGKQHATAADTWEARFKIKRPSVRNEITNRLPLSKYKSQ